jgi:hypothetical protein
MKPEIKRPIAWTLAAGIFLLFMFNCVSTPELKPEPPPTVTPPDQPLPDFVLKSHHAAMGLEMSKSYDQADEILLGIHTGSFVDETNGLTYFFENFQTFNKTTLSWGPVMEVVVQVLPHALKPEIITQSEFRGMIPMDKVGICWDSFKDNRYVYMIEGESTLLFLDLVFDEVTTNSYRYLIDTYPATRDCDAKTVFDLMIREHYAEK